MQCKICKRDAKDEDGLCRYHHAASTALKKGYERWNDALSGMPWNEYLNRVKTLDGTGQWVKEVVTMEENRRD